MANDEYREQHERDRARGLVARQETRQERAIRREVANEIADECARRAKIAQRAPGGMSGVREGMYVTWLAAADLAREIGTREAE